jgi:hypothetical protein
MGTDAPKPYFTCTDCGTTFTVTAEATLIDAVANRAGLLDEVTRIVYVPAVLGAVYTPELVTEPLALPPSTDQTTGSKDPAPRKEVN